MISYYIRNLKSYLDVFVLLNVMILRAILSRKSFDSKLYLFRRNIHRIEKGLNNRARRIPFAQQYAEQTYQFYSQNYTKLNRGDSIWALKVLRHYSDLHELSWKFEKMNKSGLEKLERNHTEFTRLQKSRISVRNYKQTSIDINEAISLAAYNATLIPSSCNRQSYNILVPKNEEQREFLYSNSIGLTNFTGTQNTEIVAFVFDLESVNHPRDFAVPFIDVSNSGISFSYALTEIGLSSCYLNWPFRLNEDIQARRFFNMKRTEKILFCMVVGESDGHKEALSGKKEIEL